MADDSDADSINSALSDVEEDSQDGTTGIYRIASLLSNARNNPNKAYRQVKRLLRDIGAPKNEEECVCLDL